MKPLFSAPERLEDRIAPAGVVTISSYDPATGKLSILGDGGDNKVTLFQTAPGHFRLASFDPLAMGDSTEIDFGMAPGVAFIDLTGKLQEVVINLGGGNDALLLEDLPSVGSLVVNMGAGDDDVLMKNVATSQQASIDLGSERDTLTMSGSVKVGSDLTIEDGGDGMNVAILADLNVKGMLVFAGNSGADMVSAGAGMGPIPSSGGITVGKGINFLGGSGGADSLSLGGLSLKVGKSGDRSVLATASPDGLQVLLAVVQGTLASALVMTGDLGIDSLLTLSLGQLTIGKNSLGESIHFAGGAGGNTGEGVSLLGSCTLTGGISVVGEGSELSLNTTLPGGVNFPFGNLVVGKLKSGDSISMGSTAAAVALSLTTNKLSLNGGISATGAQVTLGASAIDVKIGRSPTGHSILVQSTDAASLIFEGLHATLKGGVEVSAGTNSGVTAMFGAIDLALGKTKAGDSLRLANGIPGGELAVQVGTLKASGRLTYLGGSGADTVQLGATLLSAPLLDIREGGGTNGLEMQIGNLQLGAFSYLGGDSDDTVLLDAGGKVAGDLTVELRGATSENHLELFHTAAGVADFQIGGNLKITSTSGAVQLDTVKLDRLTVAKTFVATLGASPTALTIEAMTVKGTTTINTGDGDDIVNIERDSGFRNSAFKDFTFDGGAGADTVRIGDRSSVLVNATNRVAFSGLTKVMGGDDNDTLNADFQTANPFTTPPTVDSF